MINCIKRRLSAKIFIITFLLLGAACSGTYFFISKLLPTTYSNFVNSATEKAAMHLAEQMADFNNIDDCENELADFSAKSSTDFMIIFSNLRKCWKGLLYQAFPAFCVSEDTPHIMAFRSLTWR